MAFLELRNVRKGYGPVGRRTEVLGGIDLSIEKGEFVSIVGFSGSGKTTLISILAGLLAPDSGEVLLDGKPVTGPGRERAVVFQNYSLLPWMSV
ncbi:MAG TPA: ATP-binding cassette domain-containing protein, partial [Planctomycetota bacterium]|nr:ATP-binding cassette domain-containing protein [Planctomycetota bacterium]